MTFDDGDQPCGAGSTDSRPSLVSIVIPVYNGAHTIRACLDAILALDYPREKYEVIVVDNNSSDGTDAMVLEYGHVTLLYERSMQSAYAARNTGIRHASGEIVAFTDADCIARPNWLRDLVEPFQDPTVGGVGGEVLDSQCENLVSRFIQRHLPYRQCDGHGGRLLPALIGGNAAYRRQDLLDVGLFNTMFDGSDIDLSWRLQLRTGKRICFVPEAIVHHVHRSSVKSLFWWQYRFGFGQILMACLYRDFGDALYNPKAQLRNMGRQLIALATYVLSFVHRFIVWSLRSTDRDRLYVATPCLFLVADGGLLLGRLKGLWATRCFRSNIGAREWEEPIRRRP